MRYLMISAIALALLGSIWAIDEERYPVTADQIQTSSIKPKTYVLDVGSINAITRDVYLARRSLVNAN